VESRTFATHNARQLLVPSSRRLLSPVTSKGTSKFLYFGDTVLDRISAGVINLRLDFPKLARAVAQSAIVVKGTFCPNMVRKVVVLGPENGIRMVPPDLRQPCSELSFASADISTPKFALARNHARSLHVRHHRGRRSWIRAVWVSALVDGCPADRERIPGS